MKHDLPKISSAYQSKLTRSVISVTVFFIVYLILILFSLVMICLLGYGALEVISLKAGLVSFIIAIGLVSIGVFVFIFLVKFIFKKRNYVKTDLIEVTQQMQPELFAVINEVASETKVRPPKKVYLSPEVNASVSYDSVFWSMFLPVKKNLTIGLGLINTCSIGELKTILAHEFGHFSQRSMVIGGYVNQVEKIIFETVYNNKDYENFVLEGSGYPVLKFFGAISILFINAFRHILKSVSDFLFRNHASLRREMEFHADAVSTYVTNPHEQISVLLRSDLAAAAFNGTVHFYQQSKSYPMRNMYQNQASLMKLFSERNNHPYVNQLPKVDIEDLNRYNKTKVEIEDPWAYHPETSKRIAAILRNATKNVEANNELAEKLIRGFDQICSAMTAKVCEINNLTADPSYDEAQFLNLYNEKFPYQSFGFNGYYENYNPVIEDPDAAVAEWQDVQIDELFQDNNVALVYEKNGLENDIRVLRYLKDNPKVIKTFRYDGKLYKCSQAGKMIPQLEKELERITRVLSENDQRILNYFYHQAETGDRETLIGKYRLFSVLDKEFDVVQNAVNEFSGYMQFMTVTTSVEDIPRHRALLLRHEKPFKQQIAHFLNHSAYKEFFTEEQKDVYRTYVESDYIYFNNNRYLQTEVDTLFTVVNTCQEILNKTYLDYKRELLDFQSGLYKVS
ncbi:MULTISPECIES: M48 family metallopeptidase [Chryseobacterium]|uniref:Zn-dependent protease with chaperone function n=1 Tax=Chryseobacterium camelliae TaxID=1265445 RepID=A0ABU0TH18_9FLAO|nr:MULTISPECIES: M48 family metallopeptidase [Chryseobacterium]MDT3406079.1 Zn-dependent protease with chaperone function [Pseudacidovorax intermedius]MDQ1096121.1 Zn-dependent protease with chaperone function [Chryseobacterium camelliae]MDQ1100057.1 Zn-dependent protease with chaperone function [Chryseobacterium sp. SORGH_AS_1048]MDR6087400.1 Zn-dependent protease with chaperone function [Chryseobacterium sp. SORGH_AS_0909]MDR6131775.1 Zn-dependent protease with chaperone function [Chryseobac